MLKSLFNLSFLFQIIFYSLNLPYIKSTSHYSLTIKSSSNLKNYCPIFHYLHIFYYFNIFTHYYNSSCIFLSHSFMNISYSSGNLPCVSNHLFLLSNFIRFYYFSLYYLNFWIFLHLLHHRLELLLTLYAITNSLYLCEYSSKLCIQTLTNSFK